jgi:hypothetical protein
MADSAAPETGAAAAAVEGGEAGISKNELKRRLKAAEKEKKTAEKVAARAAVEAEKPAAAAKPALDELDSAGCVFDEQRGGLHDSPLYDVRVLFSGT